MPDNHPMSPPMSEYPLKITATSSEPQKQSKRRFQGVRRWYLGGLLLLGVGYGIGSMSQPTQPIAPSVAENEHLLPVEIDRLVQVNAYQQSRTYTGEIVAQNTSDLGFERGGTMTQLLVTEGQWVNQGTPLARLDDRQLIAQTQDLLAQKQQALAQLKEMEAGSRAETIAAAQANLAQEKAQLQEMEVGPRPETIAAAQARLKTLQAQLALARSKQERRQNLYTQGAISREQFDEVVTDMDSQQARVNEAQSQLDELLAGTRPEILTQQRARIKQAQSQLDELLAGTRREVIEAQKAAIKQLDSRLASIELDLEKTVLKAPFSGKIQKRYLDQGTAVQAGQGVVRLVQLDGVKAHIGVPTSLTSEIKMGQSQTLKIDQKSYSATVKAILPELDAASRTVTVVFQLKGSGSRGEVTSPLLTTGQIVTWQWQQNINTSGYWLPSTALVKGIRGLWSIYVLGDGNAAQGFVVERRDVEVLYTDGERVLVRGTLDGTEKVITNGTNRIISGQKVKISKQ
jgi:RND family efflux transporter MFP subunit